MRRRTSSTRPVRATKIAKVLQVGRSTIYKVLDQVNKHK
ncbi:helix-turn-helix domain-containing protein [Paenibacillus montanisoli]